jgi:ATP-binding cassette subfamily C (CFTR/MRP) protein 1
MKAGFFLNFSLFLMLMLGQGIRMLADWWVGAWAQDFFKFGISLYTNYIWIYSLISLALATIFLFRGFSFAYFVTRASQGLQTDLVAVLMRTPLWWYDITPMGRILTRTSKDQDNIDSQFAFTLQFTLTNLFLMLGTIVLNGVTNPYFFIMAGVLTLLFYLAIKLYLISAREIKRL